MPGFFLLLAIVFVRMVRARWKINLGMPQTSSKLLHASWVDHHMGNLFLKASNAEEEQILLHYVSVFVRQQILQ